MKTFSRKLIKTILSTVVEMAMAFVVSLLLAMFVVAFANFVMLAQWQYATVVRSIFYLLVAVILLVNIPAAGNQLAWFVYHSRRLNVSAELLEKALKYQLQIEKPVSEWDREWIENQVRIRELASELADALFKGLSKRR